MHRLFRQCLHVPVSVKPYKPSKQLACIYHAYRTHTQAIQHEAPTSLLLKHQNESQKNKDLWQVYQHLSSQNSLAQLQREDFLILRSDLWKQANWGTEDRILQVLDDMKTIGHIWSLHEYNEYFMAKLFKAEYSDILQMYNSNEFRQQQRLLSVGSFNVILATYIQLGQHDQAIKLIQQVVEEDVVVPDIRDFDRTMHRCMPKNTQVIQTAKELIVRHAFLSTKVLDVNLIHLFREKRLQDIKWIVDQQKHLDLSSFNVLIKGFFDARMVRDATQIYQRMQQERVRPNHYICVSMLAIYAHTRDVAAAEQVVRETVMGGHKLDEIVYNQLIKVYFKARQSKRAFQAFEEVQRNPDLKVNDVILNTMINGLIINKELTVAGALYRQMIQNQLKPDMVTLNTMLKGYVRADDMASAAGIISDMFKLGMEPDSVTLTTLVNSVFDKRQPQTADEMMRLVQQMGISPNVFTYNAVLNGWIQANQLQEAEKTLELMTKQHIQPTIHTYTNLIQGYIAHMNLPKAMETFQRLMQSGVQPDRATFNFMIVGFLNHGRLHDAYTCLDHMLQMNLSPTKDTWSLILEDCCRSKDWQTGKKIIEKLDQSGFVIKSDSLKRSYTKVKSHCS
ncbi:hypothetical protein BD560DRAFT_391429 [Blakeslea trispora]|nr:hypothetical protein BD560DRAFT_391429 [Blakeslea trispora]